MIAAQRVAAAAACRGGGCPHFSAAALLLRCNRRGVGAIAGALIISCFGG